MELTDEFVNFDEALEAVLENVPLLPAVGISVGESTGYVAAGDVAAEVDSPAVDMSLMDGFAVASAETAGASKENPVRLRVAGVTAAGGQGGIIGKGECLRIFTGAPVPQGADAVVPVENCEEANAEIIIKSAAAPGEHVQPAGENFRAGGILLKKGAVISPGIAGMLAAAGVAKVPVYRRPRVAVVCTGDELVEPGAPLPPGKIHASNLIVLSAWLERFGMECITEIVVDKEEVISEALQKTLEAVDVIITTGGAWGSERDLVKSVLEKRGWKKVFSKVKMRPGKGTAFGLLNGKPVFCLPGSPSSCEIAFLELALPGLLRMAGCKKSPFREVAAILEEDMRKTRSGWKQFIQGVYKWMPDGSCSVVPLFFKGRFKAMAGATCIISVLEDAGPIGKGQQVSIQLTCNST